MNAPAKSEPTAIGQEHVASTCPRCGTKGRKVALLTMRSLLLAEAQSRFDETRKFLFCNTDVCEVVYLGAQGGEQYLEADLTVPVFQKSDDPSCLVCYCFGHTVEAVREDAVRTGAPTIADDITEKCRQGLDSCEETNPQGACCLGNVRQVARAAIIKKATTSDIQEPGTDEVPTRCCTHEEEV